MKNEIKDWKELDLEKDEIEMLESIENGEWKSIGNVEERRKNLKQFFSNYNDNLNSVNIELEKDIFDIIQNKSKQYGISYKELIERLVKNFAIGNVAL